MNRIFIGLLLLALVFSCKKPSAEKETGAAVHHEQKEEAPLFTILNPLQTGIRFVNQLTETATMNGLYYEYYYNGAGLSVADINNDGLQDIFFISNLRENKLYLNEGNLKFKDITAASGLTGSKGYCTGVVHVDINNDGLMDYYISKSGKYDDPSKLKNELWINQGTNAEGFPFFKEAAAQYGLDIAMCSTQAAFFDYDRDGDLDMFLINHHTTPFNYAEIDKLMQQKAPLTGDRLFQNTGKRFVDVSEKAGITNNSRLTYGLGLSIGDVNNDGWPDIYVANDYEGKDFLYLNNGNGTFSDVANLATGHTSFYSMGTDMGDINNDGWLDVMTLDMMAEDNYTMKTSMSAMNTEKFASVVEKGLHYQYMYNALQLNNGVPKAQGKIPVFSDVAQLAGVAGTDWSWGPLFFDMDNDGFRDIFVSNGIKKDFRNNDFHKRQKARTDTFELKKYDEFILSVLEEIPARKKENYFFRNNGNLSFTKKNGTWLIDIPSSSNGAAYADLDNDGDLDLVVNNADDASLIYKNNAIEQSRGNYLKVKFNGPAANIAGIGTRVQLHYSDNKTQLAEHYFTRGFQSAVGRGLHFGLGKAQKITSVHITWPDGKSQELKNVAANQEITVKYSDAKKQDNNLPKGKKAIFHPVDERGMKIDWKHKENDFDDFKRETLLPHKMSRLGPALEVADINGDGRDDFFVGGAKGQPAALFLQSPEGCFSPVQAGIFKLHAPYEDVAATFFDADNDGDPDLYVVSGGNENPEGADLYQDRFYENQEGVFNYRKNALPRFNASGGCLKAFDYDNDGDLDLLVGGRQTPGKYPQPTSSCLLRNDSDGKRILFTDVTATVFPQLEKIGMVTSVLPVDFDKDGRQDIILTGEWMPIRLFQNVGSGKKGKFTEVSEAYGFKNTIGWWNTIKAADFDRDGDMDLIAGNLGLNYKYKATAEKPFQIYGADFDGNGTSDIVLGYYEGEKLFPLRGRQCSSNQMPFIKKKFPTYDAFGRASLEEVYGKNKLENALKYKARTFATIWFENTGNGHFKPHVLDNLAQITSVNDILIQDFTGDGLMDLLLAGNLYNAEVETPRNDAGYGLLMAGNGEGHFTALPLHKSGLYVPGEVRQIRNIRIAGQSFLIFARNNDRLKFIEVKKPLSGDYLLTSSKAVFTLFRGLPLKDR